MPKINQKWVYPFHSLNQFRVGLNYLLGFFIWSIFLRSFQKRFHFTFKVLPWLIVYLFLLCSSSIITINQSNLNSKRYGNIRTGCLQNRPFPLYRPQLFFPSNETICSSSDRHCSSQTVGYTSPSSGLSSSRRWRRHFWAYQSFWLYKQFFSL